MSKTRALFDDDHGKLLAIAAFLFGSWLRLYAVYQAGFPIGDGGLFYIMIRTLQNNGYRLPDFVSYNGLNIPFV